MQNTTRTGALILGSLLFLGLSSLGYLVGQSAIAVKSLERTVTVKGLSEREVAANAVAWPISFQVAGNSLEEAYNEIETKTRIVNNFLAAYGLSQDEISLSPPAVTDLFAQQWGNKENIKFRYTGTGSITVYSEKVDAVRSAMSNLVELGKQGVAVSGNNYAGAASNQFLFTKLNMLKPEMIEEATRNARSVAEKFAQDSNSQLGNPRRPYSYTACNNRPNIAPVSPVMRPN